MVVEKIFRENMAIEVYDEDKNLYCKTFIEEVDKNSLIIGVPMKGQNQLFMRENKTYALRLAVGDALYSFNSKMIGRRRSGNIYLSILEWPDEIKRSQRRQFLRMPVVMEIHYWIFEQGNRAEAADMKELPVVAASILEPERPPPNLRQPLHRLVDSLAEPEKTVVIDISGGGLAMAANRCIPENSLLAVRVFLQSKENRKAILLKGRVACSFPLEQGKGYRLGIEFEDINEKLRDDLINFVFELSREKSIKGT